jgi:hypothetical protein
MTLHQKAVRLVAENFRVHQTVQLNDTAMSIARRFGVPDPSLQFKVDFFQRRRAVERFTDFLQSKQ